MAAREDIIAHFQWLVDDDTIDSEQEVRLCNIAYLFLCAMEFWCFLDSSASTTVSGASVALPSDFLFTKKLTLRQSASSNTLLELTPVAFKDRLQHLGDDSKYYIDQKNSVIRFCKEGTGQYNGWLAIHDYQYLPEELDADADVPVMNKAFHYIIAYEMAKQYYFNDQGEKSRSWNNEMQNEYNKMLGGMRNWDAMMMNVFDSQASVRSWNPGLEGN